MNVHGTCLSVGGTGVLLRGPSGCGKSSLALRLIDRAGCGTGSHALEAVLVADDQVLLDARHGRLFARAPEPLAGLIEVRGLGIVPVARRCAEVALAAIVEHAPAAAIERLPAEPRTERLDGVEVAFYQCDFAAPGADATVRACAVASRPDVT